MKISELLKRENNNLDLIRIILATTVIIGHAPAINGAPEKWVDFIGYFFNYTYSGSWAVKLFFFISGLVVTNSYLHKKNHVYFIISRIFRVLPLLFVVLLITFLVFGPIVSTVNFKEYFFNTQVYSYFFDNLNF